MSVDLAIEHHLGTNRPTVVKDEDGCEGLMQRPDERGRARHHLNTYNQSFTIAITTAGRGRDTVTDADAYTVDAMTLNMPSAPSPRRPSSPASLSLSAPHRVDIHLNRHARCHGAW